MPVSKETIHICYMIDEKYLDLTKRSIDHIKRRFKSNDHKLQFYIVGIEEFDVDIPQTKFITSPHKDMPILWARVHLPEIIGTSKMIFIDSDTIALTCISKLWDTSLEGNIIAAAQHCACGTFGDLVLNWRTLDFSPFNKHLSMKYFNCGVMVFDCEQWLSKGLAEKCLDAIHLYRHTKYRGYDEPGFNFVLRHDWKQLDQRWNYLPLPGRPMKACHILHYYGEYPTGTPRHDKF